MKLSRTKIAVLADTPESVTSGGLFIPETYRTQQQRGVVIEKGPGTDEEPMEIEVGDYVIFGMHSGMKVFDRANDKEWLIMNQGDILFVDDGKKYKVTNLQG